MVQKKKKKPAANPARGFATTSIASKPKPEQTPDSVISPASNISKNGKGLAEQTAINSIISSNDAAAAATSGTKEAIPASNLSPEEFERQLEEADLQNLVEKYAVKSKRDATRQISRLQTDRRLLRGQADTLNTRKWLPPDVMDDILQVISAEGRPNQTTDSSAIVSKPIPDEDLIVRLWTLKQTLEGSGFLPGRIKEVLSYVLDIADKVQLSAKESVWGLEEALDWLSRNCDRDELPDYDNQGKKTKLLIDTPPIDTPSVSGANTPRIDSGNHHLNNIFDKPSSITPVSTSTESKQKQIVEYDSDIEPENLMPVYLDTMAKLFHLQQPTKNGINGSQSNGTLKNNAAEQSPEIARLHRKLKKIEGDILFDQYLADQQWTKDKIALEKAAAIKRSEVSGKTERVRHPAESSDESSEDESEDEISKAAKQMAADILEDDGSDLEGGIADLFASLPQEEVDPLTGKSSQVVNNKDGTKVKIRDFGKTTGVAPRRVLEEACRARDAGVKFQYVLTSDASYVNRHSLRISWSKAQDGLPTSSPFPEIECSSTPKSVTLHMVSISTPDAQQSESYIATTALFLIFSTSVREEKAFLRLPANWRELWTDYASIKKELADSIDRDAIREFRDVIREKRDREEEDGVILTTAFKRRAAMQNSNDPSDESGPEKISKQSVSSEALQRIWYEKSSTESYRKMEQFRMNLPMWGFKHEVLNSIEQNQIVIICGETGCGKSTQVPAFILESQLSQGKACKIYCTEPRRISALSLAKRVSEELGERKGDVGTLRSLVGYAIRLESSTTKETRLVYATTGIVMRMLEGSNDLKDITHIVLDEVHERSIDSDFLLLILRKVAVRRPELRIILMSATVDADRFSRYLDGAPVLQVPGRTFPVKSLFLEDAIELTGYTVDNGQQGKRYQDLDDEFDADDAIATEAMKAEEIQALKAYSNRTRNTIAQMDQYRIDYDLVTQLIATVATDSRYVPYSKAILVFLPGIGEIRQLNDMLVGHPTLGANWYIYPLHSTIASEDQEAAFAVPPPGFRKIVLATNIAETGITIPDVTCVIDIGKHKEMRFDERRQLSRLLESFVSRANAKQRRGRAGRVQEGMCFHMYTKYRHDKLMAEQQTPEFLRLSLQDLAIRVKICKIGGIEETLAEALDPPSAKNIRRAIDALIDSRALTAGEDLTPLGLQLAKLPLDVFLGKLVLLGSIFKCLDAAVTIAAILSSKSPFSAPFGARNQADTIRLGFRRGDSDLLTVYNAYLAWKKVCSTTNQEFQFCKKNFLSSQTLNGIEDLKGQLTVCLVDAGFLPLTSEERSSLNKSRLNQYRRHTFFELPQRSNANSDNDLVITSVIGWSFYPKLLTKDGKGWRNVANNQSISLHPSSVNKGHPELQWLSYYHIMQAKSFYNAHETTSVPDFSIALLCGDVKIDIYAGVIVLDGNRARFSVSDWKTMLVIKTLRAKLRELMTRYFKQPGKAVSESLGAWFEIWQKIFSQENLLLAKGFAKE